MGDRDAVIPTAGADLMASVSSPSAPCRGGLVLLHPAQDGSRRQFLFEDLATRLPRLGIGVLRYDRRGKIANADVPYADQVGDLEDAFRWYREQLGPVPIGLWGFSQGAWVAMLAAAGDPSVAFLILVGASAVSPAQQMRFGTAEQLRRAGYDARDLAELAQLRAAWERWQRGASTRQATQAAINALAGRPWYDLSWVPRVVPDHPAWTDMDFDPAESISRLTCPVLVFYGDDEWVPVADSIRVWKDHMADPGQLTTHRLAGTGHFPTLTDGCTADAVSPDYVETMNKWLTAQLGRRDRGISW